MADPNTGAAPQGATKTVKVPAQYTPEDVARALANLEKQKAQSKAWREKANTPEGKAKAQAAAGRRRAIEQLTIMKAKQAGIVVTADEVDRFLASKAGSAAAAAPKA